MDIESAPIAADGTRDAHDPGELTVLMKENEAVRFAHNRRILFAASILLIGCGASVAFYCMGIVSAKREQQDLFLRHAVDLQRLIVGVWRDYEFTGLWIHESCRELPSRNNTICSREVFSQLARYIDSKQLDYQALEFMRNVSHDEREEYEAQSRAYYREHYPLINYTGITGCISNNGTCNFTRHFPPAPFYFPVQNLAPIEGKPLRGEYALRHRKRR